MFTMELKQRLYSRYELVDGPLPTQCWNYTGCCGSHGYGMLSVKNKRVLAHRTSYEIRFGPIQPEMYICHHCDNRKCINPRHLFLGTPKHNTDDMSAKGRAKFDINAKLTDAQAREIKDLYFTNLSQTEIGRRFGVSQATVSRIGTGISYWWV